MLPSVALKQAYILWLASLGVIDVTVDIMLKTYA